MKLQQAPCLLNLTFLYYQEEQMEFVILNTCIEILTYRSSRTYNVR